MSSARKRLRFLVKIASLIVIGLLGSFFIVSRNARFKKSVEHALIELCQKSLQAHCQLTVESISVFPLAFTLTNVEISPFDIQEGWSCYCKKMEIGVVVLASLVAHKTAVTVAVLDMIVRSDIQQDKIVFLEKIKKVLSGPASLPCFIYDAVISSAVLQVEDSMRNLKASVMVSGSCNQMSSGILQGQCALSNGQMVVASQPVVAELAALVSVQYTNNGLIIGALQSSCIVQALPEDKNRWSLTGRWRAGEGFFTLTNQDRSLYVDPLKIALTDKGLFISLAAQIPLSYAAYVFHMPYAQKATGICAVHLEGVLQKKLEGTVSIKDLGISSYVLDSIETSFVYEKQRLKGSSLVTQNKQVFGLDWVYSTVKKQLLFAGDNQTIIALGDNWCIPEQSLQIKGKLSDRLQGAWSYKFFIEHQKTKDCGALIGTVICDGFDFKHTGTLYTNDHEYDLHISNAPFSFALRDQEQTLLSIVQQGATVTGQLDTVLLQHVCKEYFDTQLLTEGALYVSGMNEEGVITGVLEFTDGMIRKPPFYNFLQALHAKFLIDFSKLQVSLYDVGIGLQKGDLRSSCIRAGYNVQHKQVWWHAPVTVSDCFVNWKKELYVLISGALIAQKKFDTKAYVQGFIALDSAQLKENIFSEQVQQQFMQSSSQQIAESELQLALSLATRIPLEVTTSQLSTKVHMCATCTGSVNRPELQGVLALEGGVLHFPAYALSIKQGKIRFPGITSTEPYIELLAQARIKKYNVHLLVQGTAQDPQIIFDAQPTLSQEQIMMLLLAGSQEESLNMIAPALVMRNIQAVLFGPSQASTTDWLAPLHRIKFIPHFTDQTGRGGFKGVLEIEVNKKLRATIEKNFSLTEDVAFGAEYAITDDVSVYGELDERGDLGAELEMRFKF